MKLVKLLTASAVLFGTMALAGCGGNNATPVIEKVTNFTINPETGEFSFTGVKEAKTYYVRVYNHIEEKTLEDGTKVELGLEDKVPIAARRIRFKSDVTEYSGELDFSSLVAGNDYDAYVYTYVRTDAGDLEFAYTDPSAFVFKKAYPTPELVYGSNKKLLDGKVTDQGELQITMRSGFFDFSDDYSRQNPNYKITIYDLQDAEKASKTISYATDVETVESTSAKGGVTYSHKAVVSFPGSYDMDNYKISIQVLSTNAKAFYDSEMSEKGVLSAVLGDPDAAEQSGGGGGPGSK